MPNPIANLATARLLAEAITPLHFNELHRLHSDPQVMKTLSADGKPLSEEASRERLDRAVDHWRQHGFGLWVFHRKKDVDEVLSQAEIPGQANPGCGSSRFWYRQPVPSRFPDTPAIITARRSF